MMRAVSGSYEALSESAASLVGAPCTIIPTGARCGLPNESQVFSEYAVNVVRRSTGGEVECVQVVEDDEDDW